VHKVALSFAALLLLLGAAHVALHFRSVTSLSRSVRLDVADLYGGRTTWPQWDGGPSQLLVLGYEQSNSHLLARLLMLCGVFAGELCVDWLLGLLMP